MPITLTPEALARTFYTTYDGVYNRRDPYMVDRKAMPFLSMAKKRRESAPLAGADGVIIKYKLQSNLDIQGWERKDQLVFSEQNIELQTQFPWSNIHEGLEIVHDDIESMGYIVLPNQPRGKNFARADSKSEMVKMVDWQAETIEAMMDKMDVNEDQLLLRDNSANPKLPQGWDAYWPIGTAPGMTTDAGGTRGYYSLGEVGGKLRSSYPDVLQHYVWFDATYGAGGSARQGLTTCRREAQLRSRGRTKSGIRAILAGSGAIDRYVAFATANNIQFRTEISDGMRQVDIGIPDTGLHFEGIPIVHCPTFEILDGIENPTIPWTRRMLLIDDMSFCVAYAPGKEKFFSAPMDEGNVRVTRLSLDSKLVLLPKVVNANAVFAFAA